MSQRKRRGTDEETKRKQRRKEETTKRKRREHEEETQRQATVIAQLSEELAAMQELVLSCAESEDAGVM